MSGIVDPSAMPSTPAESFVQNVSATVSATSGNSLLPSSPLELLTLPMRVMHRAETFAFSTVPRHVARLAGLENVSMSLWGGPATAGDTGLAGDAMAAASQATGVAGEDVAQAMAHGDSWYVTEFLQTMRKVGGFFGYLTSIWSFACLVEVSSVQVISGTSLITTGPHTQPNHDLCVHAAASPARMGEATCPTYHPDPVVRVANHLPAERNSLPNFSVIL